MISNHNGCENIYKFVIEYMSSKTKTPKTLTTWFAIHGGIVKQGICIIFKKSFEYKTKDECNYLQKKMTGEVLEQYQSIYGKDISGYYVDGKKSEKSDFELETQFIDGIKADRYNTADDLYKISVSDITNNMRKIFDCKCHKLKMGEDSDDEEASTGAEAKEDKKTKSKSSKKDDSDDEEKEEKKSKSKSSKKADDAKPDDSKKAKSKKTDLSDDEEEIKSSKVSKTKSAKKADSDDEETAEKSKSKSKSGTSKKSDDKVETKKSKSKGDDSDDEEKEEKKSKDKKKSSDKDKGKVTVAKPTSKIVIDNTDDDLSDNDGN